MIIAQKEEVLGLHGQIRSNHGYDFADMVDTNTLKRLARKSMTVPAIVAPAASGKSAGAIRMATDKIMNEDRPIRSNRKTTRQVSGDDQMSPPCRSRLPAHRLKSHDMPQV
jgi:hypothetical protein